MATTSIAAAAAAAAGLHAPADSPLESPEHVDVEFWQAPETLGADPCLPSILLDENGKPPFYSECSEAIRYSTSIMTTLIHAYTQPFYHATCPQFALCPSQAPALKPSPPDHDAAAAHDLITFSYSGDHATTRNTIPGLDVAHERELFYITSSIIQITKASPVIVRLAENYLNRITPLITQLRAHKMTGHAGHDDCCWTLASLAPPTGPPCPLPSCETSRPPLFRSDGAHLVFVGDGDGGPTDPARVTLPLRLDGAGHARLARDAFTAPVHALPTDSDGALGTLLERPVGVLSAALLLAAKAVNEANGAAWLPRIAHTTVQPPADLRACERALLRALQWHTAYTPAPGGTESPAIARTLAPTNDADDPAAATAALALVPVLGGAPAHYQCVPWMLWQHAMHPAPTHAAIARAFRRPAPAPAPAPGADVQRDVLAHLAWLSRTVAGTILPADEREVAAVERRRLDCLVGVGVVECPPVALPGTRPSTIVRRLRRVSAAVRRHESRMLKRVVGRVEAKKPQERALTADAL